MKMVIDQVEITYHFISDEVVFIDLFYVPTHLQGKGLGASVVKKFIETLPTDVIEIRAVAAKNLTGRVVEFWLKQGFSFLYDIKEECFDDEILYAITMPINGGNLRKFIYRNSFENEIDCF